MKYVREFDLTKNNEYQMLNRFERLKLDFFINYKQSLSLLTQINQKHKKIHKLDAK